MKEMMRMGYVVMHEKRRMVDEYVIMHEKRRR